MEEKGQQVKDRVSPASVSPLPLHTGDGLVSDNYMDKPLSPKNERIVSPNPSPDAAIIRNMSNQSETLNASGAQNPVNQSNIFTSQEQTYFYGGSGYDDGSATWGDYSNYVHANNLQVMPSAMYNDNASLLFHPAYGFDAQVAYGQFSPVASPLSPIMIDGQLFSPHQVPMSPNYFSQPVSPHVTSALPTDLATSATSGQEALSENVFMGPGSGYYLQYGGNSNLGFYKYPGDIGSAESAPNRSMTSDAGSYASPLTSAALYPAPVGALGSYEHIFSQIPQQQTAYGYGSISGSSTRRYPQSGSYRGYNSNSLFHGEASRLNNRFVPEKGGRNRDRDAINMISEPHGTTGDRNRGPRASKPKGNNNSSADGINEVSSTLDIEQYNRSDFVTTYDNAKFFVIKSFSEDNVHKSIKYNVWASTPLGNRKLDAAYQEAKESGATCPVFLFFSVNASGQFCGVAEMVGPVDFVNDAEYWQQDRWSGQFRVKWHIIKDVPNSRFRHILLENNDNKPVTHSRDSQEVKLEAGNAMLKIFKDHDADTSILDDFGFYDEREKDLQEKRAKERDFTKNVSATSNDTSINQLADKVAESLHVEEHREIQ
ncbi:YTH domain-containing protein ECT3 isoform X1 [Helianthus annuus]|uniref:YTH domain-containing protein ECT3 isoform X1 n=1 Tax=Helianthus annuus TaxID=4232 RepID=UPI000B90048D|nr:YTH domain-containing protein ECT3 isoform X1 [Helianthus annuus]